MFHTGGSLHAVVDKGLTLCLSKDIELKLNSASTADKEQDNQPLRLHPFICTAFRSELNVAENGAGRFIKNGARVSAHHAILQGVVLINGVCCKSGRTVLKPGDVVSLRLAETTPNNELIAWEGSVTVATKLDREGKNVSERKRDMGKRKGRMFPGLSGNNDHYCNKKSKTVDAAALTQTSDDGTTLSPFTRYYRETLGSLWSPDVEAAMARPLPLTIRVLKPTCSLEEELRKFGFRNVTDRDFTLHLSDHRQRTIYKKLDSVATQELLGNTWIMDLHQSDALKKRALGVFLSDARISGELLQQELNSMLPVSIIAAILMKNPMLVNRSNTRFLDLCAAPGSKTCQLLNTIHKICRRDYRSDDSTDFTVIANELVPQRATRTQTRCFFQGNKTLSHLIVTSGDGRLYSNMDDNYFDFILCDVPCSGDGTIRKSPEKLGKWTRSNAEKNKPLQKELLKVGLNLLKPSNAADSADGGVLLYSTCSLNPVENDEVIYETISEMNNDLYQYDIVDLGDVSISRTAENEQKGNFLRVLPASSHGGFFVCALKKMCTKDKAYRSQNIELGATSDGLIETKEEVLSYSISPCTQKCCIDLCKTLLNANVQLIGCGVPTLYRSNERQYVLQEGCSCLPLIQKNNQVPLFEHTDTQFQNHMKEAEGHLTFPVTTISESISICLKPNMACLIKIHPSNAILPARIIQVDSMMELITVELTVRPQIMKREIGRFKET